MTFRRSAPAALIVAVVIVVAGLTLISNRLFGGLTAAVEESQFQLMQSILDTALRNAANEALARAEIIASLPTTKQAVAAGDRARLLAEYAEMFTAQQERRGVDQAQFHVPPAQSLLRLHNPPAFGDDLTRFRPMVVAVNRERAARKGLAIARRGPAIFGVAPIQDAQGKHLGSFEFGLEFGPLLDGLKAAYGLDFSLFVEEKPLREFARGLNPAMLSDQNRVGRFIRFHTTNGALMKELAGDADISAVSEPARYTRDAQGVPYGVLLVPLRDGAGDPLGRGRGGARLQRLARRRRALPGLADLPRHRRHRDSVGSGDRGGARLPVASARGPRRASRCAGRGRADDNDGGNGQILRRGAASGGAQRAAARAGRARGAQAVRRTILALAARPPRNPAVAQAQTGLPTGKGLPVQVKVGGRLRRNFVVQ